MCEFRPCWGTVEEFKVIIAQGHATKLMIDYYQDRDFFDGNVIYILSGATPGNECSKADFNPTGQCPFLVDRKCSIHDIKPLQGSTNCCKMLEKSITQKDIAAYWNTPEGKQLVEQWKVMVNYQHKEDNEGLNPISAFELLIKSFRHY